MQELGPHADLDAPLSGEVRIDAGQWHVDAADTRDISVDGSRQDVHTGRPDEMPDERMRRPFEELLRRADLHDFAVMHHHDRVGERERLGLVVRHIEHRRVRFAVHPPQFAPQLPLEMGIDHRQRFVEQYGAYVLAHEAAAKRDLLFHVGRKTARDAIELTGQAEHPGDDLRTRVDLPAWKRPDCAKGTRGSRPPSSCRR